MTKDEIQFLKSKVNNGPVKIQCLDSEKIIIKVRSVSEVENDIVYEMISSSHPNKYANKAGAHLLRFDEIKSVEK